MTKNQPTYNSHYETITFGELQFETLIWTCHICGHDNFSTPHGKDQYCSNYPCLGLLKMTRQNLHPPPANHVARRGRPPPLGSKYLQDLRRKKPNGQHWYYPDFCNLDKNDIMLLRRDERKYWWKCFPCSYEYALGEKELPDGTPRTCTAPGCKMTRDIGPMDVIAVPVWREIEGPCPHKGSGGMCKC